MPLVTDTSTAATAAASTPAAAAAATSASTTTSSRKNKKRANPVSFVRMNSSAGQLQCLHRLHLRIQELTWGSDS